MADKKLKELLNKYLAPSEFEDILDDGIVIRSRVDKEKRCLEVTAAFSKLISKNTLFVRFFIPASSFYRSSSTFANSMRERVMRKILIRKPSNSITVPAVGSSS